MSNVMSNLEDFCLENILVEQIESPDCLRMLMRFYLKNYPSNLKDLMIFYIAITVAI